MNERFVEAAVADYGNSVLRAAASVSCSKHDAEDIFSDVFFALYRYNGGFSSARHLKAWLIRVAVNKAKNLKKSAHNRKSAALTEEIASPETAEQSEVFEALRALEPRDRAVIYLHYFEGYQFREIAMMMDMREGTVRSVAHRARESLKEILEPLI